MRSIVYLPALVVLLSVACFGKEAASEAALEKRFTTTVRPFVDSYCISCHSAEKKKGDFDLSPFTSLKAVNENLKHWELALERLEAKEMPPKKAEKQPTVGQRKEVIDWILAVRRFEADRNAGDPGVVLARRLSNAEYDYTIRDLTGVDIRPTREFPVDPANQAGFDNSGESLTMSPALLKKYLQAAKDVADHLVLTPDGLSFAPHPVITETDRDKYCVQRIVDFYQRQPTDLADYFTAAWKYKNRSALGKSRASLEQIASESKVSAKYLATVWGALTGKEEVGPIAKLQTLWNELPRARRGKEPEELRARCVAMRDFVAEVRTKIKPEVPNLRIQGVNPSAQALVLWKNREMAANHTKYDTNLLQIDGKVAN
ncbi:MAG TPA: DUF1587 domain-containing protein, partial [Verrucomicrobiae bacterium]|nr:DUF1587 domain-containing protein [Verrucomicrobiae bacterium]